MRRSSFDSARVAFSIRFNNHPQNDYRPLDVLDPVTVTEQVVKVLSPPVAMRCPEKLESYASGRVSRIVRMCRPAKKRGKDLGKNSKLQNAVPLVRAKAA